ncbi:MAG: phosphatidylinositol-specific phospholipase C domain-containing protein [Eubacterium sp.]|nr:phosphatidylinositol-specific phospholipase C domain-containing protein [Eubacterium sp.]
MEINLCKWMKELDGSKPVLEYNLVGTHDSVTQYVQFSYNTKCQDESIYDQLCLGVRMLDIRVESNGKRLKMVHAFAKAFNTPNHFGKQMDMADVLKHCYRFLSENPSETIIFQFKNDNGRENEKCFNNLFYTYIKGNEDKWFLENRAPLLDEARGKIILVRRCKMENRAEYTEKNTGIDFSQWVEQPEVIPNPCPLETGGENSVKFIILDRYKYKPVPRWNDCIKPFLNQAKPFAGEYILNYLSTAGGSKGPRRNAKYINAQFLNYPLNKENYYGIICCDFPTEALTRKIIETNL